MGSTLRLIIHTKLHGPLVRMRWNGERTEVEWVSASLQASVEDWMTVGVEKYRDITETTEWEVHTRVRSLGYVPSTSVEFLPELQLYLRRHFGNIQCDLEDV